MKITYKVKGLDQFNRIIKNKPKEVEEAVAKVTNRFAFRIEMTARDTAPYDTGWLSENIYSEMVTNVRYRIIAATDYAIYVELGTRYMMAQPYLYPALEANYQPYMKTLQKIFGK